MFSGGIEREYWPQMIANYIASKMAAHNQKQQIWGLSLARFDRVFF